MEGPHHMKVSSTVLRIVQAANGQIPLIAHPIYKIMKNTKKS